jgi:hypothetical protein
MPHWIHAIGDLNWITLDHILAVIAIVFGMVGIVYERKLHQRFENQEKEIERNFSTQKDRIEQIVLSVHTSYIGTFPFDLEKTIELIKDCKPDDEILIMVDFLGYGLFSEPDHYEEYAKALLETKAHVRMLIYDAQSAKTTLLAQFKRAEFPEIKRGTAFNRYYDRYQKLIGSRPETYEDFMNALGCVQDYFCQQFYIKSHIEIYSATAMSIHEARFFWMARNKEMVFSFPNLYTGRKEFSFKTRDDHLMDLFADQFEQKWERGNPVSDKCYGSQRLFAPPAIPFPEGEERRLEPDRRRA